MWSDPLDLAVSHVREGWLNQKGIVMPRQYPTAFRQVLVHRMLPSESVLSLVADYELPEQTLHWSKA